MKKLVGILSLASILVVATACDTILTSTGGSNSSKAPVPNTSVVPNTSTSGNKESEDQLLKLLARGKKYIEDTVKAEDIFNISLDVEQKVSQTSYFEETPESLQSESKNTGVFKISANIDNTTAATVAKYMNDVAISPDTTVLPSLSNDKTQFRADIYTEYDLKGIEILPSNSFSDQQIYYSDKVMTTNIGTVNEPIVKTEVTDQDLVTVYSVYNMIYNGIMSVLSLETIDELKDLAVTAVDAVISLANLTEEVGTLIKSSCLKFLRVILLMKKSLLPLLAYWHL